MALQRNVRQQNELTFKSMLKIAMYFREHGVCRGAEIFFSGRNIDISTSAIVYAQTDGYMLGYMYGFAGLIVTEQQRFFSFELEMNSSLNEVIFVHKFEEVTNEQNLSLSNKGKGKGFGALALDILEEMNSVW